MTKLTLQNESITEKPFDPAELARMGVVTVGEGCVEVVSGSRTLRFRFRRTRNSDPKARHLHLMTGSATDHPSAYRKAREWADRNLPE